MSIQRIDHAGCKSHGYQARWPDPIKPRGSRWTRFFADDTYGGEAHALRLAQAEEAEMQRTAASVRAAMAATQGSPA